MKHSPSAELHTSTTGFEKALGQYFTPNHVARSLVHWARRTPEDRMLDPSCGDGRFLGLHRQCVGVETDSKAHAEALSRAPWAHIYHDDFFSWARKTEERFDFAVGNPPFIRYQRFSGNMRQEALELCRNLGANFSALTSSWAPFLVATASLLRPGGRLAFVVPAEIGHAPYARPLLEYLLKHFRFLQIIAIREKIFPDLSEDAWLLYASGYSNEYVDCELKFSLADRFLHSSEPPKAGQIISRRDIEHWRSRLRAFLLPKSLRELYQNLGESDKTFRLGQVARVGIGYVTGANDFFHLRPSTARQLSIPENLLQPTVRTSRFLPRRAVTKATVSSWLNRDEPTLLLRLREGASVPASVRRYLDSTAGQEARERYKCRSRSPWYSVPNVTIPKGFLSYMSSRMPALVANRAGCACTNSVHAINMKPGERFTQLQQAWSSDLVALSCELEGHPLGGGVLKIEPGEAARVLLPSLNQLDSSVVKNIQEATRVLRTWRHYG